MCPRESGLISGAVSYDPTPLEPPRGRQPVDMLLAAAKRHHHRSLTRADEAIVSAHWPVEVASAVLIVVRRGRIGGEKAIRFSENLRAFAASEVESIAHLTVNLPRVHVVCASEGVAVIEQVAFVTDIGCVEGERPTLPEVLAEGKVDRGVRR